MERMQPGRISWHEMMSIDVEASKRFYNGLFRWEYELREGDVKPYHVIHDGERHAGGITESSARAPFPKWIFYTTVADVDAVTAHARELGADIQMEPWDVHSIGRAAVIMDPFGATFGIISFVAPNEQSDDEQFHMEPPTVRRDPGQFCWQTLNILSREKAAEFYHELLGWTTMHVQQDDGRHVWFLAHEKRPVATIATVSTGDKTLPNWDISIAVSDLDAAVAQAVKAGARVMKRAFTIDSMGTSAILSDPSNASFSLFQIDDDRLARTLREVREG